jgi:polysaccharide pyruvyl transferase CsaB
MAARLLLGGYFGCGNLGDDAILLGFVKGIEKEGHNILALCQSPESLVRRYGIPGVPRRDFAAIQKAIQDCDALVFPGGSIFQDVTSVRSSAYYSKLVGMAKKSGKKVALLGQGVGPLTTFFGKRFARSAFDQADVVTVRDSASVSALKELGSRATPEVTADLAWLLPEPVLSDSSGEFGVAGAKSVGIAVRPWGKDKNRTVIEVFSELARQLNSNGRIPTFIAMDEKEDGPLILEIAKRLGGKVPDLRGIMSPRAVQERAMRMEGLIAMRLHAGILAATVAVPSFLVSYDPKVTALANQIGVPTPPTMKGLSAQRIYDGYVGFVKDRDRTVEALKLRRAELGKKAFLNIDALQRLLR